jgi:hypothetical protein
MSLLRRRQRTLADLHAEAHAAGHAVLSIFHDLADELEHAANQHAAVAEDARVESQALEALSTEADSAALDKVRQARALRTLVG